MTDLRRDLQAAVGDRYRIQASIGRGGAGEVFRAYDLRHARDVAVKVLLPTIASGAAAFRFRREILLAAQLQHPHIVPVFDSGGSDDLFYYVMPLVEGETLQERLDRDGRLSVDEVRRIGGQAAAALGCAHRHGVVHRDVKPGNLLLCDGGVLVSDFGIARALAPDWEDGEPPELTATGIAVGSPRYMSPEQGFGDGPIDGRSDIYSLGCVLYHALAGRPPFDGSNARAVLARQATEDPDSIRAERPEVPADLERVVLRALEKERERRFQTAEAFGAALAGESGPKSRAGSILRQASRRHVVRTVALYLAFVLLAAVVVSGLVDRLAWSGELPGFVLIALGLMTPAIAAVAFFGRTRRRAAVGPVLANLLLTAAVLAAVFTREDLLPPLIAHTVLTETGEVRQFALPRPSVRKRVVVYPFDTGRPSSFDGGSEWPSGGLAAALQADLYQDPFFDVTTDFATLERTVGMPGGGAGVPSLYAALARAGGYEYAVGGSYEADAEGLSVRYEIIHLETARRVDDFEIRDSDWATATDSASLWVRRTLGVPNVLIETRRDRPVGELLTADDAAFSAYAVGRAHLDQSGDYETALPALERAVERDPSFAEAWASLYEARLSANQGEEAREALDAALQHGQYRFPHRRLLRIRERHFTMAGDVDRALRVARQYVTMFADEAEGRRRLADLYLQRGHKDSALVQYDSLLRFRTDDAAAEAAVTWLHLDAGRVDSSLVHLARLRELTPDTSAATMAHGIILEMGALLLRMGALDSAAVYIEEARLADPRNHQPLEYLAELARRRGDLAAQGDTLRLAWAVSDLPSEQYHAAQSLSRYHAAMGHADSALTWWRMADEASRQAFDETQHLLNLIGDSPLLASAGRPGMARHVADSAAARIDTVPRYLKEFRDFGRLELYRVLEAADSVAALVSRYSGPGALLLKTDPVLHQLHVARGDLARWSGDCDEAISHYRAASAMVGGVALDLQIVPLLSTARCHRLAGEFKAAARAIDSALALAPAEQPAHVEAARLAIAMKRGDDAAEHLRRALAAWKTADADFRPAMEARELQRQVGVPQS